MPTYEVLKDKRVDYYLAVSKDLLPKFLDILARKHQGTLNSLEENPNGRSPYEDSASPLPNMTFEYGNYQYYVRRDEASGEFDAFKDAVNSLKDKESKGDGFFALEIHHVPYYGRFQEFSKGNATPYGTVEITYRTVGDFDSDECECTYNNPDYSLLPPDTTKEFVEKALDGESAKGAFFGYFVFSMERAVAERLRELLPEDMREYLEKMSNVHAVFNDEEDDELDGCEAYLLYNVPLEDWDNSLFDADYNDPKAFMGARFVNFLERKSEDLDDEGQYAIYLSPLPGILKLNSEGINLFTTPWRIVSHFCDESKDGVSIMWGEPLYYTDEPFHLRIERFININPEILENAVIDNDIKTGGSGVYEAKWLLAPQFDEVENFTDGMALVRKDDKYGFIDAKGEIVIKPQFEYAQSFREGMARVEIDDKYGFIDKTGQIVIKAQFDEASEFSEGMASVRIDDKWGFIDKSGKIIIQPQFNFRSFFHDGLASESDDGKDGYIDKTGKFVIKAQFYNGWDFHEGLARVEKDDKSGFIDKNGKTIGKIQFESTRDFHDGIAAVRIDNMWGFIDKNGEIVINPQFSYESEFHEGLARQIIDDKRGFIDKSGEFVIKPQFINAYDFHEGLAAVKVKVEITFDGETFFSDSWGFIDKSGNMVIKPQSYRVNDFHDGMAIVENGPKYGYMDKNGIIAVEPQFDEVYDFADGAALVQLGFKWGLIKLEKKEKVSTETDGVKKFKALSAGSLPEEFKDFLVSQGYSEYTPSGMPSTAYDYMKRVERVCEKEDLDLAGLKENIDRLVAEYDRGGIKAEQGAASHSAVINALKAFQKFVKGSSSIEEAPEEKAEDSVPATGTAHQKGLMVDPREAIQDDYIACCICGEKRQSLTSKHLATHGLTVEEYKKLCGYEPEQLLMSLNRKYESRKIIEEAQRRRHNGENEN